MTKHVAIHENYIVKGRSRIAGKHTKVQNFCKILVILTKNQRETRRSRSCAGNHRLLKKYILKKIIKSNKYF